MATAGSFEVPRRSEAIAAHRAAGGEVAAVYPIHYPRALLRAFGLLPVEIWGPPAVSTQSGDAHLQAYTCSVVRCGLSFLLDGGLDAGGDVGVIVSPHACDSLQGLGSLLLDFVQPDKLVLPLYVPRASGRSDARYFADELRAGYEKLAAHLGRRPDDAAVSEAVLREEEADAAMRALLAALPTTTEPLSDTYRLLRSREYLPAETFIELAASWLERHDNAHEEDAHEEAAPADCPRGGSRVPLILSGLLPEPMSLFASLDEAGARVVADDMACTGRRAYPSGQSSDPFVRMAEGLLAGPPDPTRGGPIGARTDYLVTLAKASGARGVLFYEVKFCEPELFYLPRTRAALDKAGLRSLVVEVDIADPLSDQLITRLEAFVESLQEAAR